MPRDRVAPSAVQRLPTQHTAPPSRQGSGTVLNVIGVHLYLEDNRGRVLLGLRHPRQTVQGEHGLTGDDLRAWRLAPAARGRRAVKK